MTASRRALVLTTDYPPERGGIQTMAREIAERVRAFELRVIAPAVSGSEAFDEASPVPVTRVRSAGGRRGLVPALAIASARAIRAERPDVVLAMHTLAAPGALMTKAPLALVCHGGELRGARIRRVARWALPRADRVIANSRFTRSHAVALGADPLRVTVLPVGAPEAQAVDLEQVAALRARLGGGRIVLSVARLEPHKGQDVLIRALELLPDDVRLVLVGQGAARGRLHALAGHSDRVVFAGVVPDDELPMYFAAADCFALLSRETSGGVEGAGIAVLEAFAYGLPVVAGRSGGIPETVRDAETGLLVDPDDRAAAAGALRRVLEDTGLATRLGEAGRALAEGERSWARFVERMETVMLMAATRSKEVVA